MTPTFKKEDYLGTKYERPEREDVNVLRRYGDDQRRQLEGKRILLSRANDREWELMMS